MVYVGVLWNTVNDFKDVIVEDIEQYGNVLRSYELDLGENYADFVKNIYECDGIAQWKIDLKLEHMLQSDNTKIVVLFIDVDDEKKEFNERKNKEVIVNIETLKTYIRDKYSKLIDNYFFDNVFHMTDDKKELKKTLLVLRKWCEQAYDEYEDDSININLEKRKNGNNKVFMKRKNGNNENKK